MYSGPHQGSCLPWASPLVGVGPVFNSVTLVRAGDTGSDGTRPLHSVGQIDPATHTGRATSVYPARPGTAPARDVRGGGRCSPLRRPVSWGVRFVHVEAGSARKG